MTSNSVKTMVKAASRKSDRDPIEVAEINAGSDRFVKREETRGIAHAVSTASEVVNERVCKQMSWGQIVLGAP